MFKYEKKSIEKITVTLKSRFAEKLILVAAFGSRVRGDYTGESDFDVLVVLKSVDIREEAEIIRVFSEEEDMTGIPYSPVIKSLDVYEKEKRYRTEFYRNLENEGIELYVTTG